jgi:hypothetical protein
MAKLNEGDVIEGIFTIALCLYLAYGKVEKKELNKIRTKVDTKMFSTGRFKYTVVENHMRQKNKNPPDFFNVYMEMRLKPESVQGAFDKEYEVLYKKSSDIGKIDSKINQLIAAFEKASFAMKAKGAVDYFLDNNSGEVVTFKVVADGIEGESSGGEVKGDVSLEVYAVKKGTNKKLISGTLPFSLKSESVTVANLSPYRGMLDIAEAVGIKWDGKEKFIRLSKPFVGPTEQKAKFQLIKQMYDELVDLMITESKKSSFSDKAYDFLDKSIFGSDLADVVDIQTGKVKEITREYFNQLKKNVKLVSKLNGNNLVFVDKNTDVPIFQIRTKLRPPPANEAKFYLEVGKGIYAK